MFPELLMHTYILVNITTKVSCSPEFVIFACPLLFASHPYLSPDLQLGAPDVSTFLSIVATGIPFVPTKPERLFFEN